MPLLHNLHRRIIKNNLIKVLSLISGVGLFLLHA